MSDEDFNFAEILGDDYLLEPGTPTKGPEFDPSKFAKTTLPPRKGKYKPVPNKIEIPKGQPVPKRYVKATQIANAEGLKYDEYPPVKDVPNISLSKGVQPDIKLTALYKKGIKKSGVWTQRRAYEFHINHLKWFMDNPQEYFASGYFVLKGVNETMMYEIRKRYPICMNIFNQLREVEEYRILKGAATEKINNTVARFFLNCRYGTKYVPNKQLDTTIKGKLDINANTTPVAVTFEVVTAPTEATDAHQDKP